MGGADAPRSLRSLGAAHHSSCRAAEQVQQLHDYRGQRAPLRLLPLRDLCLQMPVPTVSRSGGGGGEVEGAALWQLRCCAGDCPPASKRRLLALALSCAHPPVLVRHANLHYSTLTCTASSTGERHPNY